MRAASEEQQPLLGAAPSARGPGQTLAARRDRSFMPVALAVWLCTLPFVFLLVTPFLGVRAAVTTSLAILVGLLVVCWDICAWRPPGEPLEERGPS